MLEKVQQFGDKFKLVLGARVVKVEQDDNKVMLFMKDDHMMMVVIMIVIFAR